MLGVGGLWIGSRRAIDVLVVAGIDVDTDRRVICLGVLIRLVVPVQDCWVE